MRKLFTLLTVTFSLTVIVNFSNAQCIKTSCNGSSNTGTYSSAIGNQTNSSGNYGFSSGNQSSASGESSTALGYLSLASGIYSFAVGYKPQAQAQTAISIGYETKAKFAKSFAIGEMSETNAVQSYAFGQNCFTNASQSLAIGRYMQTNASGAIALGSSTSQGPLVNGINNSLMIGFNSTVATLFVGPSPSYNSSGNVGIGTTAPTQKLDIDGNIRLRNNAIIGTWSNNTLTFNTNSVARMEIGADGNIGISTTAPTQKLDIDGNIRLRNNAIIGTWSNNSLTFNTNSSARMTIAADGNVAIGNNTNPQARLHIKAEGTQDAGILLEASGTGKSAGIFFTKSAVNIGTLDKDQPIAFFTAGTDLKMKITPEGNVGIGVASPLYKLHVAGNAKFDNQVVIDAGGLYVNGEVKAKKFHASISPFPDFVFEPGYKLLSINEVESFINQNGHLPGVPNAAEVEQNGIELGEMNALLLQKIEELTLYIIAQDKEMKELKAIVETLK